MAYPCLEELLTFEENVFLPRGVEISQLEHFPRNFNPFVLKQYLVDAHHFLGEYQTLLSFYNEVALPLNEKKGAAQKELKEGEKVPRGITDRLESLLLLPYTITSNIGDHTKKITGSPLLGNISMSFSVAAGALSLGYISTEAQIVYSCSVIAGFYREHKRLTVAVEKAMHFVKQTTEKQEKLDDILKRDFPLIFGRGYEDLDTLGREIYIHFESKKD